MKLSDALKSNISYEEKVQLACDQLPATFLQHWAIDCAESVLHIYEQEHPNDTMVRNCINVAKLVLQGKLDKDAAYAARSAAYSATRSAAKAAYYVANSAADAADAADAAAYAAANSAANYASSAAYYATYAAAENKQQQEQLNIELLLKQVEVFESPLYIAMQEGESLDENKVVNGQ